ncbi:unnamed protein product [Cylindrotheca closterium]|uniref:Uncharacterized protein n=1 Tax=Cylindrotheca closterium TaxID=2856 RepID=A0AAD2G5E1_9STRA|nr:unnamed protein product [Cylindrotheca closterium]
MDSASRSFRCNGSPISECRPSKVRKTSRNSSSSSSSSSEKPRAVVPSTYFPSTKLGFWANEFLPMALHEPKVTKKSCPVGITMLSDDILGKCFFNGYLDTFETLKLTSLNKRTRRVGLTQIQHLDLRKCKNLTVDQVTITALVYQNLRSLDFAYNPKFGRDHLSALVETSKNLRHLVLKGTAVDDHALIEYLKEVHSRFGECKLLSLDLCAVSKDTCLKIGDKAVEAISQYCPKLKCLKLGWCKNVTDNGIGSISKLKRLTELDLSLTSITIKSCYNLLEILGPNLEVLDLSATSIFQLDESRDSAEWITFSKVQNLSTLKLQFCEQLSAALIEHIVQNAASLKSFDVKHSGAEGTIRLTEEQAYKLCARNIRVTGVTMIKR